jgi:hypothetical protein
MREREQKLQKPSGVPLEAVAFYMDAVDRDRLDAAGASRRAADLLALRDRMLRLNDAAFDVAIRTIKNVVEDVAEDGGKDGKTEADARKRRLGSELYERSTGRALPSGSGGRAQKVAPT